MQLLAILIGIPAILLFGFGIATEVDDRIWQNPEISRNAKIAWAIGLPTLLAIILFWGWKLTFINIAVYITFLMEITLVAIHSKQIVRNKYPLLPPSRDEVEHN